MLMIDMTEEPECEEDVIFKAQNIVCNDSLEYLIPVQDEYGSVVYLTLDFDLFSVSYIMKYFYNYILDNM